MLKKKFSKFCDTDLVKLSLEDQNNFRHIINRYENKLRNYVFRLTNISNEDSEDLLQEIFLKIYINLNEFKLNDEIKFSSWIYRIAHNHVISNFRKLKARPQVYHGETNDIALKNIINNTNIINEIDTKLLRINIYKVINNLPLKYKEVLVLKFFEEKSYEEMSDILKKPPGTIATLINRAKKIL